MKAKTHASGGEVCHLESRLRMRFPLRSSGKITFAFKTKFIQKKFKTCLLNPPL
ncbi:hypothetical protein DBB_24340 [Desulfoluna spongiiphila]|nr:hypothetical protein DBB_24340 [Desulfoluna spongiiphila]